MSLSSELGTRHKREIAQGIATKDIYIERAENAELWDVDGRRFIDFTAGIAVLNTGHRHPHVMKAVEQQLAKFTHSCFNVAPYEGYIRLAERLNTLAPTSGPNKTLLVSTGVEAVENAIKIARYATGRSAIIAFSGSFHGRTMMGMALTGKVSPYKKGFGAMPADIFHAPFPHPYHQISVKSALDELNRILSTEVDPERIAALIIEPVQGEGGFNIAPPEFLRELRAICDRYGILFISDEIQTGIARTGKMFAIEHSGVVPDMITMAKGLTGGFPLSAVTGRADIIDSVHPGGLGGTFAGNPLCVAAANAVLDVIETENLCNRAVEVGDKIQDRLQKLADLGASPYIGDIRGLGAMVALELVKDPATREPDPNAANELVAAAQKQGVIILACGTRGNVVRFLVPLTIPFKHLNEGLDMLEKAYNDVAAHAV